MTDKERKAFSDLEDKVLTLEKNAEKIYHYTEDLPDWARTTVQKLLDKGIYQGSSDADLNLPETLMRVLVINDRAGLYN